MKFNNLLFQSAIPRGDGQHTDACALPHFFTSVKQEATGGHNTDPQDSNELNKVARYCRLYIKGVIHLFNMQPSLHIFISVNHV